MINAENKLVFAVPKGRILKQLLPIMKAVDLIPEDDFFNPSSRKLIFTSNQPNIDIIRVRSFDAATFVAFGAAHMGVVGSDVIEEFNYSELYAPLDLKIGKCRLSLACETHEHHHHNLHSLSHIRIATKYPYVTQKFFAAKGLQAECIKLNGAMELAPKSGLSKYIVDLVETGDTLKANGLKEVDTLLNISSRLVVNRVAWKTKPNIISDLTSKFKETIHAL